MEQKQFTRVTDKYNVSLRNIILYYILGISVTSLHIYIASFQFQEGPVDWNTNMIWNIFQNVV